MSEFVRFDEWLRQHYSEREIVGSLRYNEGVRSQAWRDYLEEQLRKLFDEVAAIKRVG